MTATARTAGTREPRQERSRLTRERLLRAAIDALASDGWAAATVAAVAERAGVSRGAAQHHFPTREDLITAVLEQVFDDMTVAMSAAHREPDLRSLREAGDDGAGTPSAQGDGVTRRRAAAAVDRAVTLYTGTEFKAALQVWAAAASDPALRELILPLEAKFARAAHRFIVGVLDPEGANPNAHRVAQVTLDLARGLGLADTLSDDSKRRAQVVATWTELVARDLG
ncbi:TetR family transcriptional regulator [Gordonia sinesedis]